MLDKGENVNMARVTVLNPFIQVSWIQAERLME